MSVYLNGGYFSQIGKKWVKHVTRPVHPNYCTVEQVIGQLQIAAEGLGNPSVIVTSRHEDYADYVDVVVDGFMDATPEEIKYVKAKVRDEKKQAEHARAQLAQDTIASTLKTVDDLRRQFPHLDIKEKA